MGLNSWDLDPYEFGTDEFVKQNRECFDEYISLKIRGQTPNAAFRMAFGHEFAYDNETSIRIYAVERSLYFRENFDKRLQAATIGELWNPKIAVHALLSIVRDYTAKDSARLRAMQELNILTNIVIVDENGKTKAGRNLADFYAEHGTELAEKPRLRIAESDLPAPSTAKTRH